MLKDIDIGPCHQCNRYNPWFRQKVRFTQSGRKKREDNEIKKKSRTQAWKRWEEDFERSEENSGKQQKEKVK